MNRASDPRGTSIGCSESGTNTSSNRFASAATGISESRPTDSSARTAAASWPLPPSTSNNWGGY